LDVPVYIFPSDLALFTKPILRWVSKFGYVIIMVTDPE
jgi:hypothetical protein